jgi:hypothetical protein
VDEEARRDEVVDDLFERPERGIERAREFLRLRRPLAAQITPRDLDGAPSPIRSGSSRLGRPPPSSGGGPATWPSSWSLG